MTMRRLLASYRVRRGREAVVIAALEEFVAAIRASEPGTLAFEAFREGDGVSFVHFMIFQDEEAEAHHRGTPHVKKFVAAVYPLCELEPQLTELTPVGRPGATSGA